MTAAEMSPTRLHGGDVQPGGSPPSAFRILAVDDNVDGVEMLADMLRLSGHDVLTVYDGPAALAAAPSYRPDVVLLDIGLPGLDGYVVVQELRKMPGLRRTLLVALTGYGREEDRRRSQQAGFHCHLIKPVDFDALQRLLANTESYL
jgi:CheY-like chemotaxis protein